MASATPFSLLSPFSSSSLRRLFFKPTAPIAAATSRRNPNPNLAIAFFSESHSQSSNPQSKPSLFDSLVVICASVVLSFSVFVADVDQASAFVVTKPRKLQSDELATVRLFQDNTPSVVYITNLATKQDAFTLDVFEVPQGSGSGFVWDKDGHIVTNYHVIRGASDLRLELTSVSHKCITDETESKSISLTCSMDSWIHFTG